MEKVISCDFNKITRLVYNEDGLSSNVSIVDNQYDNNQQLRIDMPNFNGLLSENRYVTDELNSKLLKLEGDIRELELKNKKLEFKNNDLNKQLCRLTTMILDLKAKEQVKQFYKKIKQNG